MNRLLFGDNLGWLRDMKVFRDASVDLIYLDPPFNSNAKIQILTVEGLLAGRKRLDASPQVYPFAEALGKKKLDQHVDLKKQASEWKGFGKSTKTEERDTQ